MLKTFKIRFNSTKLIFLIGVVSLMLTGCYSESDYSGDGQLIDYGRYVAKDRYVLNLGNVDLE